MVPNSTSPRSARSRSPGTSVQQPAASGARRSRWPAAARSGPGTGRPPCPAASASTSASVRVSCQTMAWATGSPVRRSHSTVVSRWLVMPMAATSSGQIGRPWPAPRGTTAARCARSPRRRAPPSPAAGSSGGAPAGRPRRSARRGRRRCSGSRWCPGRWPRRTSRPPAGWSSQVAQFVRDGPRGVPHQTDQGRAWAAQWIAHLIDRSTDADAPREQPAARPHGRRDRSLVGLELRDLVRPALARTSTSACRSRTRSVIVRRVYGTSSAGALPDAARPDAALPKASSTLPSAVACAGSRVPISRVWWLLSGRNTWWTTSTCRGAGTPIRTACPLRAASGVRPVDRQGAQIVGVDALVGQLQRRPASRAGTGRRRGPGRRSRPA